MHPKIQIRGATNADDSFIFATWLRSYRHSSQFAKRITNEVYFKRHHKVIERILERTGVTALVAVLPDDPTIILGYLIGEQFQHMPVIHFVYVKQAFRNNGIAQALFNEANFSPDHCAYSHRTYELDWIEQKFPGLTYDPYLI